MSKDIWHFPSEAPAYCFQCVFYDTASNEYHFGQYSPVFKHFRSGNAGWEHEEVQRFAFAKDIIACLDELERTRKALEQSEICCTEWEKQALDYKAENIALLGDLECTRKALGYAIDVIQTVAKMSDKLSREYGETLVEQLDNIQAYCWQEGYVLTHEQDLERAITALEQKDN